MTFIIIVWGARGRWFESSHPDNIESIDNLKIVDAFLVLFHVTMLQRYTNYPYIRQELFQKGEELFGNAEDELLETPKTSSLKCFYKSVTL